MNNDQDGELRKYRALLAPGTTLREGLERILRGKTGALLILGYNELVKESSGGGFNINVDFTPTALRELAKMDGAIILSDDLKTILSAGVHLVPPSYIPTAETGTRHRSADRTSKYAKVPAVTVSASMSTISLFLAEKRYAIEQSESLLSRANQALRALSKYRDRLNHELKNLTTLEVRDQVTVRDLTLALQRFELVDRLAKEVQLYIIELGIDGRLIRLQQEELTRDLERLPQILYEDYANYDQFEPGQSIDNLHRLDATEILDFTKVANSIGLPDNLDMKIHPRGVRLLHTLGQLPLSLVLKTCRHFNSLQGLMVASTNEIAELTGAEIGLAKTIRAGLIRLAENANLD